MTTDKGDVYSGIFFGALIDKEEPKYLLKMVQQIKYGNKTEINGAREPASDFIGVGEDHAISLNTKDVVDLCVDGVTITTLDKRPNGGLHSKV